MAKKKNRNKKKIILAAVAVALIGVVFFVFNGRADKNPKICNEAVNNLAQADTLHAKTQLVINLPEKIRDKQRPLTTITINLDTDLRKQADYPELAGPLKIEARGPGNSFFTNGDLRILTDEVAFRLSEFPALLNPSGSLTQHWTYVPIPLLATGNSNDVRSALALLPSFLSYQGKSGDGGRWLHFQGVPSAEVESQLMNAFQISSSGNHGLNVLARLLAANNVDSFDVWIDPNTKQLRQVKVHFIRPLKDGANFDFATLSLELSNYGQPVAIDHPAKELTVKPAAFANIFGTGRIEEIKPENKR